MGWKRDIEQMALDKSMCEPFYAALAKVGGRDAALKLYKAGIDWALEHDCPSVSYLRKYFSTYELEHFGIYVDREFSGEVINYHIWQVFHNCTGRIKVELNVDKCIIPTLYLANNSNMSVYVDKFIDIPVFLFDTSKIEVDGKWCLRHVTPDAMYVEPNFKPNIDQPDL